MDWNGLMNNSWMRSMSGSDDLSVKSILVVGGVFHSTDGSIGFMKRVFSFNYITITNFMLALDVTGVRVRNSIVEFVFWMSLKYIGEL